MAINWNDFQRSSIGYDMERGGEVNVEELDGEWFVKVETTRGSYYFGEPFSARQDAKEFGEKTHSLLLTEGL